MDTIQIREKVFLINTDHTSYMFRVDQYGHLEHIHYGTKVPLSDWKALSYKKLILHGDTILYDKKNDVYSVDSLPQEFGSYGVGDFNEASIEIEGSGSFTCDFTYEDHEVFEGDTSIKDLPSAYGAETTLVVRMKDKVSHLKLDLYYAVYPECDVIARRAVLSNSGKRSFTLHKLMSYCMDLAEDDLVLMDFFGAWDKETHINERPLVRGTYTIGSRVGFSSAKNNPGFIVRKADTKENSGKAWGFNLVYSGNHYSSISKNEYAIHRIQGGISPERFHLSFKAGDVFETPQAVMTFSADGLNTLSQHFHDFINEHIIRSDWKKKERPVLINSWEGFGFKFKKDDLIKKLARNAKKLGIELFVLDDGWFGRRNSDKQGLGDYNCNTKKIPGGISSLSSEIHKMDMLFGIWVEPEAINVDSKLYEDHPDYALSEQERGMFFGRNELLMDLTRKDVQDYIIENVSKLIDDNSVDYIKWDMNRMMDAVSGTYNHEYIKGLYHVLDAIFTPRPWVLLESCSSGGNRFDLGMLCYSPQIWSSDDTDPIERIDIQKGLSYLYPLSTMGAHVSASPHMQTLRATPLETRFNISAYGCLGYELDLSLLSVLDKAEVEKQVAYYKQHRFTFQYGRFYRVECEKDYEMFEVFGEDEAVVSKFRRLVHAVPVYDKLYAYGLEEETAYFISSKPYLHNLKQFGNLVNFVTPVKVNAEGKLMETISKFKGMEASIQEYQASGIALKEGICLNPLFLGTGYNDNIRIPLDYGSDMYEIKEIKHESGKKK